MEMKIIDQGILSKLKDDFKERGIKHLLGRCQEWLDTPNQPFAYCVAATAEKVNAILTVEEKQGVSLWRVSRIFDGIDEAAFWQEFAEFLRNQEGIHVVDMDDIFVPNGFTPCETMSSFNQKGSYHYSLWNSQYLTAGDPKELRDHFEKTFMVTEDFSLNDLTYKVLSINEVASEFQNYRNSAILDPLVIKENTYEAYPGFHYFSPLERGSGDIRYLIALCNDRPVGVIEFGHWYDGVLAQSYIDVACNVRQKGIARKMIEELDRILPDGETLHLSMESWFGREIEISAKFQKYMTRRQVKKSDY